MPSANSPDTDGASSDSANEASKRVPGGKFATAAKRMLQPVFNKAWDIKVEGLENIPDSGGAILTPNHTSVLDSFVVPAVLDRQICYVGKAEYMDDWKTRKLFPALGMIPIDRSGGESAQAALDTAARILADGKLFGIYPEGTRARDGNLHRGHTGPARLALRTGCPLIPVGIIGTREVQPPDQPAPKPGGEITIKFGRPIDVSRYRHLGNDRRVLRQITDELMFEIRTLTGQSYIDTYANKANAAHRTVEERVAASTGKPGVQETAPSETAAPKTTAPETREPVGAASRPHHRDRARSGDVGIDSGAPLVPRRSSAEVMRNRPVDLVPVG